jgi:hypothetical protein
VAVKSGAGEEIRAAMRDLRDRQRVCTRQVLAELTGLKLSIVDDHVKRMKDDGTIRMVVHGVFELVDEVQEDRPVSATYLPNGRVKVEVGDELMELSLREARALGMAVGGTCIQFSNVR